MTRNPRPRLFLAQFHLALFAGLVLAPAPASASTALRNELGRISDQVVTILAAKRETAIGIGAFDGPATFPASSGPGVAQILKEELQTRDIEVRRRAKFGLKGSFSLTEMQVPSVAGAGKSDDFIAVKVTVVLVDEFDNPVTEFTATRRERSSSTSFSLRDEETVTQLVGLTSSIDPETSSLDRNRQLREQIIGQKPAGDLRGAQLFAGQESPYGMEIRVEDTPRTLSLDEGLAFVPLERGETYAVRLINNSEFDAAVALTIDGISTFTFCNERQDDGSPRYEHYIIPARNSIEIKGWFSDLSEVEAFLVDAFEEGVAAALNQTADVGTVTARFHAAWPTNGPRPNDEPDVAKGLGGFHNATGRGETLLQQSREVPREIGVLRSSISVRYERPSA